MQTCGADTLKGTKCGIRCKSGKCHLHSGEGKLAGKSFVKQKKPPTRKPIETSEPIGKIPEVVRNAALEVGKEVRRTKIDSATKQRLYFIQGSCGGACDDYGYWVNSQGKSVGQSLDPRVRMIQAKRKTQQKR